MSLVWAEDALARLLDEVAGTGVVLGGRLHLAAQEAVELGTLRSACDALLMLDESDSDVFTRRRLGVAIRDLVFVRIAFGKAISKHDFENAIALHFTDTLEPRVRSQLLNTHHHLVYGKEVKGKRPQRKAKAKKPEAKAFELVD